MSMAATRRPRRRYIRKRKNCEREGEEKMLSGAVAFIESQACYIE